MIHNYARVKHDLQQNLEELFDQTSFAEEIDPISKKPFLVFYLKNLLIYLENLHNKNNFIAPPPIEPKDFRPGIRSKTPFTMNVQDIKTSKIEIIELNKLIRDTVENNINEFRSIIANNNIIINEIMQFLSDSKNDIKNINIEKLFSLNIEKMNNRFIKKFEDEFSLDFFIHSNDNPILSASKTNNIKNIYFNFLKRVLLYFREKYNIYDNQLILIIKKGILSYSKANFLNAPIVDFFVRGQAVEFILVGIKPDEIVKDIQDNLLVNIEFGCLIKMNEESLIVTIPFFNNDLYVSNIIVDYKDKDNISFLKI